jgi:predicted MFS family arabinose efflux permease
VLGTLFVVIAGLLARTLIGNEGLRLAGDRSVTIVDALRRMAGLILRPWTRVILATVAVECALSMGVFAYVAWDLQHRHGVSLAFSGLWIVAYPAGGLLYAALSGRLIARLGERGLALAGGLLLGSGYLCLLLAPAAIFVLPGLLAVGIGFAMLHNTLQVNATQMAPEARGAAVSLFAFCLFTSQSAGVALVGQLIDAHGMAPAYLAAALGLPLLALEFRRRLGKKLAAGGVY